MATHYESIHGMDANNPPPKTPKVTSIKKSDPEHHSHYDWIDENDHSKGKNPDKPIGADGQPLKPDNKPIELIN